MTSHAREVSPEPDRRPLRRKLFMIVITGAICLTVALVARHYLHATFDPARFDGSPLPRSKLNAPFIMTPDVVVERMVELAGLSGDDLIYDLGCGDGRIVITASLLSGCRGIGFDIEPARVAEATENARLNGVEDRVTVRQGDVFQVDLSEIDVAMMYLLPWMMNDLVPQFERMKPGARIVSHDFPFDGFRPDKIEEVTHGRQTHTLYLWTIPLTRDPSFRL